MRNRAFFVAAAVAAALTACKNEPAAPTASGESVFLSLEVPAAAGWMPAGEITASGRATGLEGLTLNGVPVARNGDTYTAPLVLSRGINVVEARGNLDPTHSSFLRHAVLAGDFADPGTSIDRAAAVRVNQGGLDLAMSEVGALLDADTINAELAAVNPVYEDSYGVFGWSAVEVAADIGSIAFDAPVLEADPAAGVLTVEVALPALDVWVPVSGEIVGWDFDVDIWLGADSAEVTGLLTLDVVDGELVAALGDAEVSLVGFWYDTSLLPGEIESFLLVDTVREAVEETLLEQIEAMVPALLEEQLAALELSFSTDLLGKELTVEATIDDASIDHDGILLVADLDVNLPGNGQHAYAGYLAAGTGEPRPDTSSDVAMSLSDDLLNRVLFEAWRSGLLAMTLSSDDGTLDPILLHQLGAKDHATVVIDAALPPVVVERDGGLQAQVGELNVTILTPGGELGERLDLSVTIFVGLEIAVEDGEITLALLEPELTLSVRDSTWGVSNEAITNLLTDQLPVEALLLLVGDLRFPLPTLGELGVERATVSRDDTGVYTGVTVELL